MKKTSIAILVFLCSVHLFAQTDSCGIILDDKFDNNESTQPEWIEYNTSGRVTSDAGNLKFDHNTDTPSAYRNITPTSKNSSFTFDVSSSRNSVNCQIHLISTTGKHLSSVAVGVQTASIKYATTMSGENPSGFTDGAPLVSLLTNTVYTINTKIDFDSKTVSFFNNGTLMAAEIPFLEDAEDIAKIDIQLIYMWSNTGQFYFDNFSLLSGDENRLELTGNTSIAEKILESAVIGDSFNQHPQVEVDALQSVIDSANNVLTNCDSSPDLIDNTIAELQAAQEHFITTKVNDPVLKIYSEYNFTGEQHEIFPGYYNGTLGNYNDWVVSFTLEKGYMVTFADNVNGTGASKVYVAADNDIQINLPADLQKKASFIRVGPWFDIHKKGMAGKGIDVIQEYDNSWHYNWSTNGSDVGETKFVPNQWAGGTITKAIELGNRMDIAHYMAFNEPDGSEQANMTVDTAIEKYEAMLASGLRLGSPATKDNNKGKIWRNEFMTKAEANGLRVDYMVVHYYKQTTAQSFFNWLKDIYDTWKRPIWIKEFNYGATWTNQPANNQAAGQGLISYMNMLDDASFVERYSVFTWQPDKPIYSLMSIRNPVTLSASGIMYKDHTSPVAYTQEIYEQGQQLSVDNQSLSSKILIHKTIINNGVLNIIYADEIKNVELNIYNIAGQEVKKTLGKQTSININELPKGIYILKINTQLGSYNRKLIVQK